MKTNIIILLVLVFFYKRADAQINVNNLSYQDYNILYQLEMNPFDYENIMISNEIEDVLSSEELDEKNPIQLFLRAVYYLKKGDRKQGEIWLDRILKISTDSICTLENKRSDKIYCANFIRNLKAFVLKFQILELFEGSGKEDYCPIFHEYKIDIEREKGLFVGKVLGPHCVDRGSNPIHWNNEYYFLIPLFLEYDCMIEEKWTNLYLFREAITNNIDQFPEKERIQDLIITRIQEYLLMTENYGETRKEMRTIIRDFRLNAELIKNVWYSYEADIFGIPIRLRTRAMLLERIEWTNKEARRIERNKPIKRKREIIREFKRTKYYRLFMERKL